MKEYNYCNNCGKTGHLFPHCKNPVTSIGIIAFRKGEKGIEYLMIRRKDSIGYFEFLRGKYPLYNKKYILNILNEISNEEKEKLLKEDFSVLWTNLWGPAVTMQHRGEEKTACEKFNLLRAGVSTSNESYDLNSLIHESIGNWETAEWGFPKGRRNYQEKDIPCALREFEEETGISRVNLKFVKNILAFEEIFTGSNYKSYKHKYFLAYYENNEIVNNEVSKTEVSKIEWKCYEDCIDSIRTYNLEKKDILERVNKLLKEYRLYK